MSLKPLLQLRAEIEKVGEKSVTVLYFSGKITSDNIFDLNTRVKSIFESGIYNCILYLSELEYINSTGIALLLTIARTVDQNRGKLVITRPSPFVKELFEMTDLNARFTIAEDIESAKTFFAQ